MNPNTPPSGVSQRPNGPRVTEVTTQNISLRRPQQGLPSAAYPEGALPKSSVSPQTTLRKSYSEENPDFISIDLPSKFQFYGFKELSARTLRGSHQAKMNRAYTQNRIRFIVEAISATLEPGISAFDLTPADFYFLMYWQKVNSFTKSPQIITVQCSDPKHLERVKEAELPIESLRIEQFLNATTLDTQTCETLDLATLRAGLEKYDLGVETMRDVVEMTEKLTDMAEAEEDPENKTPLSESVSEYGWLVSRATFLASPASLDARCKIIGDMTVEETSLLEQYMQAVTQYGVEEFANVKCKECGASKRVKISFDALTFLPGG